MNLKKEFILYNSVIIFSHHGPEEWWSKNATIEDWFDEMVGIANIINKYAGIHIGDIRGKHVIFNSMYGL